MLLVAWASLSGGAGEKISIDWVSYCRGDVRRAKVVSAVEAKDLIQGKDPLCVRYEEGFYDPLELVGSCEEAEEAPPPWTSTKSVELVVELPAGASPADYEVVITVIAREVPLGCASCDPGPRCEAGAKTVQKIFPLKFSKGGEKKRWNVIEAMQPGEGREFESIKANAVMKRKGADILQRPVNITWSLCC
jgi:hypothetical protein